MLYIRPDHRVSISDGDAVVTFLGLAAEEVSEEQLAGWIKGNSSELDTI